LLLLVAAPVIMHTIATPRANTESKMALTSPVSELPDIYYIIFDEYAGHRALEREFGFNSTPFYEALRERGFTVPEPEFSNYAQTYLSLASSLNMMYLDDVAAQAGTDSTDWTPVYGLVEDSVVVR